MTVVPTRRSVMYTLKLILRKQPLGDITYPVFATETMIYDIIKPYIPTDVITMDQINDWVGKEKCFGTKTRQMIDGKRQRGRPLHVVKEEFRDFTVESASNFRSFRKMVKDTQDDWLTIGYVRKSVEVNLKDEARRCLLELMAAKMRSKMLCQQVFASWCSGAHSSILDRDHKDSPSMLYVDGDTQDLVAMATKSSKNVRLAVIDFAGFSTNPDDVYEFLK
ncbi:hypothetical protein DM01DRAFT_1138799 [Hesseltinella vesiculosa]|uniref:Uncharacterized protein n=1 Tax=Hesseltinella vesiculosa TaxID=101127 RepID=A0A1X2G7Y4_9FUNG|nr:hypothetical protein DM01DRAFT_1138799 [Hesseltinella vesiculosa]